MFYLQTHRTLNIITRWLTVSMLVQLILLYRSTYARYLREIIMMLICLIGSRMCSQGYLEEHAIDLVSLLVEEQELMKKPSLSVD